MSSNPTFVNDMNLFGNHIKQIPCIVGEGSPTESTAGAVGMLYMDTSFNNGEMWKCIGVSDTSYTWVKMISEDNREYVDCYPDWSHLKWYVMGDSLTDPAGGIHTSKFYYEYIAEKTGIQVIVDGLGGTGYHAGVSTGKRFADRVANIPEDVDIVTIFGSGNDVMHATPEEYKSGGAAAMAYFFNNRPGLPVIIVPPSPWATYGKRSDDWKNYCDTLELLALNYSLHYVGEMWTEPPFDPNSSADREAFFTKCQDGVHPDESGHRLLAPYFYNAMLEVLVFEGKCRAGEGSGQNADLKYYSEVGGGGIIANTPDYKNEIWTNWGGRLGFGMNTANAPVPFWVKNQLLVDGTVIARNVAASLSDQVNNRWGMHLFEGYSTDDYSRVTILADKFEHDYRKVACVYYYTGASEADTAYGWVKVGSDAEKHSFDFSRDIMQAHGVIDCRMPVTLARISLTNDIDTTYETVEEADAAYAAGTEWEANLRCLRYIYLKNAANGSMFYDTDIHAPVVKVDGAWHRIPTVKLTDERYTVLGQEFDPVPCTGLTLSASELTFTSTSAQTLTATQTPTDTTDRVVWESSDPSVATVKNGVVTPKWNGSCTITATCGNVKAECAVTISGVEFEPIDTINLEAGYKYDLTTGAKTAAESYFCTNKFRLSDGQWSITNRAHNSAVLVWDAEGNYLGSFSNGWDHPNTDTTTTRTILARADCLYAIQYGLDALEDDLSLMTITKATPTAKIATLSINLADCAFVDVGSNFAAYSLAGTAGFDTITSQIALTASVETASIPVFLAGPGGASWAKGIGYGLASIGWIKDGAGTYKPNIIFAGTAADANAYFAEHRTVLTIN